MPYLTPEVKRAERVLQDIHYPTTKEHCIEQAMQRGVSEDMITMLEDLPVDAFDSIADVKVAIQITRME